MASFNEAFATNMLNTHIKFDVQPYARGEGRVAQISSRKITERKFLVPYGGVHLEYEVFDLTIEVTSGRRHNALIGGVPTSTSDMSGTTYRLSGVNYSDFYAAAVDGKELVIARCG